MLRKLLFALYMVVVTSVLVFGLLEVPQVRDAVAPSLPYYAIKRAVTPDTALVFVNSFRGAPKTTEYEFKGDLYWEGFGVETDLIPVRISYDASGFRTNSSRPPYDVVVIGDSYVELSETDGNSFSEELAARSGRSTFNMGTSWYGPFQYVQLLRTQAAALRPRYALLMFYAGNDIEDVKQYEEWRRSGRYYGQDSRFWEGSFPSRYLVVMGQAASSARTRVMQGLYTTKARLTGWTPPAVDPVLALVRVGGDTVPMVMGPWTSDGTTPELLATPEWRSMRSLLAEFEAVSRRNGITPVIVYIPSKVQSYVSEILPGSGATVTTHLASERKYRASAAEALGTLARETGLCYVNLLPPFQRLAAEGTVLYHPFDTHWNERGREAAADVVARSLGSAPVEAPGAEAAGACGLATVEAAA